MLRIHQFFVGMVCCCLVVGEVCSPDDNVYYLPALDMCDDCDTCLRGMGKDTVNGKNEITWDQQHGALTCSTCIPCRNGYFNDRRGFECKPCKVCSQQNRYKLKACTRFSDAECGDFIQTDIVVTTRPPEPSQQSTSSNQTTDSKTLLAFIFATVGVFGITCTLLLLVYILRKRFMRREDVATINNNLKAPNTEQHVPLVVVVDKSKVSSASNLLDQHNSYLTKNEQNENLVENNRFQCRGETTPKVVASETSNGDDDTSSNSSSSSGNFCCPKPSIGHMTHNDLKAISKPFKLCCTAMSNHSSDDLTKSSLSSTCSALALDSFTKERNLKSNDTLLSSCRDTCILNRSYCVLKTSSSDNSGRNECSPSYYCKCYQNSSYTS